MDDKKDKRDNLTLADEMNAKGIECADRGWLDEAIRYFRKAIELDGASGHAWDNLGSVLAEKGHWREALAAYLRSVELEPEVAAGHYNLAGFLTSHGLPMAEAELKEALGLDPEYPDAHLSLGLVYADMGRLEEAVEALEAAIAFDPDDAYPRHELAVLLMEEGDVRGAIRQLREVLRIEPENFEARVDLGVCYMRKGFYAEARRALDEAERLRHDDAHLQYSLAGLHVLQGRFDEAVSALRKALAQDRERVEGWLASDPTFDALRARGGLDEALAGETESE